MKMNLHVSQMAFLFLKGVGRVVVSGIYEESSFTNLVRTDSIHPERTMSAEDPGVVNYPLGTESDSRLSANQAQDGTQCLGYAVCNSECQECTTEGEHLLYLLNSLWHINLLDVKTHPMHCLPNLPPGVGQSTCGSGA